MENTPEQQLSRQLQDSQVIITQIPSRNHRKIPDSNFLSLCNMDVIDRSLVQAIARQRQEQDSKISSATSTNKRYAKSKQGSLQNLTPFRVKFDQYHRSTDRDLVQLNQPHEQDR